MNLPKNLLLHEFDSSAGLAAALAGEVSHQLERAIQRSRKATLAVSGGRTPAAFLKRLSQAELDWTRVTVTLVDERWVDPQDERSNERLVKQNLLVGRAGFAHFVPLYHKGITAFEAETEVAGAIDKLPKPFDVVVLGLGTDGHTASWFPDATELAAATDPLTSKPVSVISTASGGEPRMTLTLPIVQASRFLALQMEGDEKRQTFDRALLDGKADELPIRHVLQNRKTDINIFWAP